MNKPNLQQTAQAIASLLPYIVQGVHSGASVKGSLTQTQFRIVISMSLKGPCTMSAMAAQMKVSMPTMTGLVNRLVAGKYIRRKGHLQDRRQVMIELTPKAFVFIQEFEKMYAKRWEEMLLILDETEQAQMYQIVHKLNRGLQATRL